MKFGNIGPMHVLIGTWTGSRNTATTNSISQWKVHEEFSSSCMDIYSEIT